MGLRLRFGLEDLLTTEGTGEQRGCGAASTAAPPTSLNSLLLCCGLESEDLELLVAGDEDFTIGYDGNQVGVAASVGPKPRLHSADRLHHAVGDVLRIKCIEKDGVSGRVGWTRQRPDD